MSNIIGESSSLCRPGSRVLCGTRRTTFTQRVQLAHGKQLEDERRPPLCDWLPDPRQELGVVQNEWFIGYTKSGQNRASQRIPRFAYNPDLNHTRYPNTQALIHSAVVFGLNAHVEF